MSLFTGFVRAILLGNLPYMKKSDRIGLAINLAMLALVFALAVLSRR